MFLLWKITNISEFLKLWLFSKLCLTNAFFSVTIFYISFVFVNSFLNDRKVAPTYSFYILTTGKSNTSIGFTVDIVYIIADCSFICFED